MSKTNIFESPYYNQSVSLVKVQKFGAALEKEIRKKLAWESGRLVYYTNKEKKITYDIQVDACYPSLKNPEVFVSVTYCDPDTPGHSNENKLQLKLGELMLFKAKYPDIKGILIIGGTKDAWLSYVIEAFRYFFDEVLFTWDTDFENKIMELKANPKNIVSKHSDIWSVLSNEWNTKELCFDNAVNSFLRENAWNYMRKKGCEGDTPDKIGNEIIRNCMQAAYNRSLSTRAKSGVEWYNYMNKNWDKLWQSRSFFNPAEAAIEIVLYKNGYSYLGGIAADVAVPSLIHCLGGKNVDNTKVSEDFITYSKKYSMPVLIQSKATGGGKKRHGKNIQNRAKEQIARSLFYRGYIEDGCLKIHDKDYIWISVLDGNWGVTKKTPLKYQHMLQWAGYDHLIAADSLVDANLTVKPSNPLVEILSRLDCTKNQDELKNLWSSWNESRKHKNEDRN